MFKSTIIVILSPLLGVILAPVATAGPYCNALGNRPSLSTAQQVIMDAVMSDDGEGIATDIVENCPNQYGIIMEAGDQLLKQMGG